MTLACAASLALGACASPGPEPSNAPGSPQDRRAPADAPLEPASAEEEAIVRATRALEGGDVATARRELERHLAEEPDDGRARYILARALASSGELRAALAEVVRAIGLEPTNPLTHSLRATLCEQMGAHRDALRSYGEVHRLVPESLDPLHGMARCLLYLGEAQAALDTLSTARERPVKDPTTEYLAFQATRRAGHSEEAEAVGRAYLQLLAGRSAEEQTAHHDGVADVRRWLEQRSEPLDGEVRRVMLEAVRAACRLRLPGAEDPGDEALGDGPARLFAFDERPVFVTLFPPRGEALRGRGRGTSLAAALKGAVQELQERPGYSPLAVRDAAVQIEVGHTLEPVAIRQGASGLETDPPLVRGLHGIAVRIDRQEAYCLPSDALTHALPDLSAMLTHAAVRGGLAPDAWRGAPGAFRFETDAWLSPAPGLAAVRLERGEVVPLPQGLPAELREAAQAGARWLTTQLRPEEQAPEGGAAPAPQSTGRSTTLLARSHDPTSGAVDAAEAAPAEAALVAWACAAAHAESHDQVLLAATDHLTRRLVPLLLQPPARETDALGSATLDAAMLHALSLLSAQGRSAGPEAEAAGLAAERLHARATPATRARAVLGLAAHDGPDAARRLSDLAAGLLAEPARDPLAVQALVALELALPGRGAGERALEWGVAQLQPVRPPLAEPDAVTRAHRLGALARVALLAARAGHAQAEPLRALALEHARGLLALQLAPRHRHFLHNAHLSLGAFRREPSQAELRPAVTAECVLALLACVDLLH